MRGFNKNHGRKRNAGCRLETPNNVTQDRLPQQHVCREKKALDDHQLCNQEKNSSMDQDNPGPPQIKLEKEELYFSQEGQTLVVMQETDTCSLTPVYEEKYNFEDQTLCAAQNDSGVNMPVISSVVSAPKCDFLLLSYKPHIAEIRDPHDDKHVDNMSNREVENNPNKQGLKRRSRTDDEYEPTVLKTTIVNHKEEIEPQCRLLDIALKPEIRLHRIEVPLQYVCKVEEEALTDQQNFDQEMNSRIEEEEPEPPRIKEEELDLCISPEVERYVVKQENDTILLTPTFEEDDHSEDQTLYMNHVETVSQVQRGGTCEKELNSKAKLHFKTNKGEKPFLCQTCGKYFRSNSKLTVHMRIHTGEKPYVCQICGKDFRSKCILTNHMSIHPGKKPFVCKTCGKGFKFKSILKDHMRIHTGEKPFVCRTCGKGFRRKGYLTAHMSMHTSEKPFVCQTCGSGFRSHGQFTVHVRMHTGEKPFVCNTCGKGFRSNRSLANHMRIYSDKKLNVCQTCGKDFISNGQLTEHMRIHTGEKPHVCKTCGRGFRSHSNLTNHMRTHTSEKPYVCQICGKDFISNGKLAVHIRIHTGEKPFGCKTCGKGFKSNNELTSHMRVHTVEKPYVCQICGKGFRSSGKFTIHMRIHTGEKPFVCQTCGKDFKSKSELTIHMRIHTGEKPYICRICGKDYRQNGHLIAHMRKTHSDEKLHLQGLL